MLHTGRVRPHAQRTSFRLAGLLCLLLSPLAQAQVAPSTAVRIEVLLFEVPANRINDHEQFSSSALRDAPSQGNWLWRQDGTETKASQVNLIPEANLALAPIKARLQQSGRYKVRMLAGWHQTLLPEQAAEPLRIAIDALEGGRHRIEGTLALDRKRYIQLDAHLQTLRRAPTTRPTPAIALEGESATDMPHAVPAGPAFQVTGVLKELRRMREGETHYLDAPGMGLLVYVAPLSPEGSSVAAPLPALPAVLEGQVVDTPATPPAGEAMD